MPPIACTPPATAASNSRRPVDRVASPSTLRRRCISRWPYSSVRSSSAAEMRTSESEPMPNRPPWARNACASNRPSPRLASVIGQSPTTALALTMRASSPASACVAWTRHQRRALDLDRVEQQVDRPPAMGGQALLDLARLFGDMDVRREAVPGERRPLQIVQGDGAQRMGRDADIAGRHAGFHQPRIGVAIADEAALRRRRRLAQEAALAIEHRQQGEADARRLGRRHDALRHLGHVVVGPAVGLVMEIVELGHRGEARLEHLHVGEGRDRLEVVRRQPLDEAVHRLAPGPEGIGLAAAPLGEARHGALEGVAVQVGQAGHGHAGEALGRLAVGFLDAGDDAMVYPDHDIAPPAVGREGSFEVQFAGHDVACTVSGSTC